MFLCHYEAGEPFSVIVFLLFVGPFSFKKLPAFYLTPTSFSYEFPTFPLIWIEF
jgi:hypothetical protein